MFTLLVRHPVNSRLSVVRFWGSQSYTRNFDYTGVGNPNSHLAQGSTVIYFFILSLSHSFSAPIMCQSPSLQSRIILSTFNLTSSSQTNCPVQNTFFISYSNVPLCRLLLRWLPSWRVSLADVMSHFPCFSRTPAHSWSWVVFSSSVHSISSCSQTPLWAPLFPSLPTFNLTPANNTHILHPRANCFMKSEVCVFNYLPDGSAWMQLGYLEFSCQKQNPGFLPVAPSFVFLYLPMFSTTIAFKSSARSVWFSLLCPPPYSVLVLPLLFPSDTRLLGDSSKTQGDFAPQGTLAMFERHFWLSQLDNGTGF